MGDNAGGFDRLGLTDATLKAVKEAGYENPTPIQAQAIPQVLMGRDILGIAQTGTGKTASFTLPMIDILSEGRARARMPRTLILEPTRELAAQVAENFEKYGVYHKLSMALLIGGVNFGDQDKLLDRGVDVLIATPGRLLDHMERGKLMLTGIDILVVDEADRMLDMGFIPDVEKICERIPRKHQTLFFSATMPPPIEGLAKKFLTDPKQIEVAAPSSTAATITQRLAWCGYRKKRETLRTLIRGEEISNGIIFCNRKRDVKEVHASLTRHGFDVAQLHGDMAQSERLKVLDQFKKNEVTLLIASDVAARGLDIAAVSHVFNFDVPTHPEDYVHRIGRTGRAGREGTAITLAEDNKDDRKYVGFIEKLIDKPIPVLEGYETADGSSSSSRTSSRSSSRAGAKSGSSKATSPSSSSGTKTPSRGKSTAAKPSDKTSDKPTSSRSPKSASRSPSRSRDGGDNVVGMGSHVPAFLKVDPMGGKS